MLDLIVVGVGVVGLAWGAIALVRSSRMFRGYGRQYKDEIKDEFEPLKHIGSSGDGPA